MNRVHVRPTVRSDRIFPWYFLRTLDKLERVVTEQNDSLTSTVVECDGIAVSLVRVAWNSYSISQISRTLFELFKRDETYPA